MFYFDTACILNDMKDFMAESAVMKTFHHPNVLALLGVCVIEDDAEMLNTVLPFMANGDLKHFLKDNRVSPNNIHEYPMVKHTYLYLLVSPMYVRICM